MKPRRRKRSIAESGLLGVVLIALAPGSPAFPASASRRLRAEISRILHTSTPRGAAAGIRIRRIGAGRDMYASNSHTALLPASVLKLFTTAAALDRLGPEYAFVTRVLAHGKIGSGILQGDLILKGSGDPSISGRFHKGNELAVPREWARAVKAAGIRRIAGDLIADDRLFDRVYLAPGWPADQLAKWYCAQVSALSFNDNCIDLTVRPGAAPGAPALLSLSPSTRYVTLANSCTTVSARARQGVAVTRGQGANRIVVSGRICANSPARVQTVTVHNPALYLATVFAEELARQGVALGGRIRLAGPGDGTISGTRIVASTKSSLGRSIRVANKRSQNLYAELILKTLGARETGRGTFRAGAGAVVAFARKIGIGPKELHMSDGCGLSRDGRASAWAVVELLRHMAGRRCAKAFRDSLAVSGVDGTLRNRLKAKAYRGRLRGKTGTIKGVKALGGYVRGRNGAHFAFAIILNDLKRGGKRQASRLQDAICRALADYEG